MRVLGSIISSMSIFLIVIVVLLVVLSPGKCEHEETVERYSFSAYDSTAHNDVSKYCKKCEVRLTASSAFNGELADKSYLEAIKEHSDGSEIVAGEYYIVTATVPLGFYSYSSDKVRLSCKVENADFIVSFSAEFREEFKESVRAVEKGDEITFRGRFYDEGCGFTDCELIIE